MDLFAGGTCLGKLSCSVSVMGRAVADEKVCQISATRTTSTGQAPHERRVSDESLFLHDNVGLSTRIDGRTTGVTAKVVERMESTLKDDVLREIRANEGRLLLHDEVETKPGTYEIIPIWEAVSEDEVMTPKELYDRVQAEDYKVDYQRVAIVSAI